MGDEKMKPVFDLAWNGDVAKLRTAVDGGFAVDTQVGLRTVWCAKAPFSCPFRVRPPSLWVVVLCLHNAVVSKAPLTVPPSRTSRIFAFSAGAPLPVLRIGGVCVGSDGPRVIGRMVDFHGFVPIWLRKLIEQTLRRGFVAYHFASLADGRRSLTYAPLLE